MPTFMPPPTQELCYLTYVAILMTKIRVPPLQHHMVSRSRLAASTESEEMPRLTLISAPAGFGKSTCAQEIAAAFPGPAAWLALDPEDSDPVRFFSYFFASLRHAIPELSETTLQALDSSASPAIRSVLTLLLNELTELNEPICSVLDDFHLISTEVIHEDLEFFLAHVPSHFHLVIASRSDPRFNLPRLRANGDIHEIRSADLRFTRDEITTYLSERSERKLLPGQIQLIDKRTEGWIAGVQMAALSINRHDNPDRFLRSFGGAHRHVVDYLTAEVLSGQPEPVQRFLIRSSIFSRLNGELCDALTTEPELPGQQTLEYLERANLFVTALDEHRRWFRLHPLFAELLRGRLEGDVRVLHRRGAQWFLSQSLYGDALPHAVRAGEAELIRLSIDGGGTPLYAQGPAGSVLGPLESLPEEVRDKDAMLSVHQAWATWTAYRSNDVPPLLARAEVVGSSESRVQAHLHALRANLAANNHEVEAMLSHASRALELLDENESFTRAGAYRAQAVAYHFSDDRQRAIRGYQQAIELSRRCGCTHLRIVSETGLGIVHERNLEFDEAERCYREVLRLAGDPGQPVTCEAHTGLGRIAYARDQLEAAEAQLTRGRDLARTIQGIDSHIAADLFLGRVYLASGERRKAERELARIKREIDRGHFDRQMGGFRSLQAAMALAAGDLQGAQEALGSIEAGAAAEAPFDSVRLRIAKGEVDEALRSLVSIEERGVSMGWRDQIVTARILTSIATAAAGDRDGARGLLGGVWAELEPEGAVRLILDEGPLAEELFGEIVGGPVGPPEPEALSRREREVLLLVAEGLSNDQIARRLFVSLSTVKGHNSRIFEKLGVRRRTEAVAEAQRRGILL